MEPFDSSIGLPSSQKQKVGTRSTPVFDRSRNPDVTLGRGKRPFLSLLSPLYMRPSFPFPLRLSPGTWSVEPRRIPVHANHDAPPWTKLRSLRHGFHCTYSPAWFSFPRAQLISVALAHALLRSAWPHVYHLLAGPPFRMHAMSSRGR